MRCGSREPVYWVVSQHLYDPTGVVSEETPATTGVFVDVPRRRITRTLFGSFITNGAPLQTRLIYRTSNCTENCVRRFAWLHDNVSVLKTFLSQCVLRCHVDTVTGGGSSGAPQYQHPNVVSRGNRPAHVISSAILSLLHLLKGDLWLGFELPTPYIHAVHPQQPLGWGARRRRGLSFCAAQCEFKSHERVHLLHTL